MRYAKTSERPLRNPEAALNLWAYVDETGTIFRLAGKSYVLDGSDEEKLRVLKLLASTDFLSAAWMKVPENFTLVNDDGRKMQGVATASMLSEPTSHGHLFEALMQKLADDLPVQLRSVRGEYKKFRLTLSDSPLTVTTVVLEREDGSLTPLTS